MDLCPKPTRKMKKIEEFLRNGFSGKMGEKMENRAFGWPAVGGYGGEWPEMFSRWWGRWWVVVGVGGFGFREEKEGGGAGGGVYGRKGKMGKMGKK
jgi:hypothetical protein